MKPRTVQHAGLIGVFSGGRRPAYNIQVFFFFFF